MPTTHLTDIVVQRLKTPGSYFDDTTPAFGIRVGKHRKTWIVMRGVSRTRIRLGHYPAVSLSDARTAARKILVGEETAPAKLTFEAGYERFKEAHLVHKKPRTQRDYKRIIDKHFLPHLRKTNLAKITSQRLAEITDPLLGTPSEHAHALAVARTFFKWCARPPRRYIPHSPLEGLQLRTGKSRKRVLTDAELVKVWMAAEEQGYPHGTCVQLLILTGQRRGEIAALCRPWLDEREKTITLPEEVTKNGIEHCFPYGGMVGDLLKSVPDFEKITLLFPSRVSDERPISGWSKYKKQMTDGVAHWTLHDLRRTFATGLARLKVPPHIVERLLNHKLGSIANQADGGISAVAEIYNRATYMPEMREAVETWEKHVAALVQAANATKLCQAARPAAAPAHVGVCAAMRTLNANLFERMFPDAR
jgi:integrase